MVLVKGKDVIAGEPVFRCISKETAIAQPAQTTAGRTHPHISLAITVGRTNDIARQAVLDLVSRELASLESIEATMSTDPQTS